MGRARDRGNRARRKNAAESDVRRMYLRGRKGTLKVDALPLEQALAQAKIGPKARPVKAAPLGSHRAVVAVAPSEDTHPRSSRKREKVWAVGHLHSASVLRPKAQPRRSQKSAPAERVPIPQNSPKKEAIAANQNRQKQAAPKQSKPKRKSPLRRYDGQPRFQGGFRFVQGGLPELGRR